MKRPYERPTKNTEKSFETSALACGKSGCGVPTGSRHFAYSYDTFTGHFGRGISALESVTGSTGVGFGPSGATQSYGYQGLCCNWVSGSS